MVTRRGTTDAERIAGLREAIAAANGDWHEATALLSVQTDLNWLLEYVLVLQTIDVKRLWRATLRSGMPPELTVTDIEDLAAEYDYLASEPSRPSPQDRQRENAPVREEHRPGDPHEYAIRCVVCGEAGTVRLSIEPRYDGAIVGPEPESRTPSPSLSREQP